MKSLSLFNRLLLSFFAITISLVSVFFISFYIIKNKYQDRMIAYNQMNLNRTVEQYEYTFMATRNVLLNLYNNESIISLNSSLQYDTWKFNPLTAKYIHTELEDTIRSNPHLWIENIYVVFQNPDTVLSKHGMTDANLIFDRYTLNPSRFSHSQWQNVFSQSDDFEIIHATLNTSAVDIGNNENNNIPVIALILKNPLMENLFMIAFINEEESTRHYQHEFSSNFWIHDRAQRSVSHTPDILLQQDFTDYARIGDNYYFAQEGSYTGLRYTDQVHRSLVEQELTELYFLLIPALIAALAVSVFGSVFFSRLISNPVRHILQAIKDPVARVSHSITEFKSISRHVHESGSLLNYYAFTNRLKEIRTPGMSSFPSDFTDTPYLFIVIDVFFKPPMYTDQAFKEEQARSFICEFVRQSLSVQTSLTFQMEKQQISSIVFLQKSDSPEQYKGQIDNLLTPIANTLEWDSRSCIFTIAISEVYDDSASLTEAFEQAQNRVQLRQLNDQLQIIDYNEKPEAVYLTPAMEQELQGYISSGNLVRAKEWIADKLSRLASRQAARHQYKLLANLIINKVIQITHPLGIAISDAEEVLKQIESCYSYEQFQALLDGLLEGIINQIPERRQEDWIKGVIDYLNKNYDKEISQEMIADRLNITTSYLSTYFKEKTGTNFKDYLNQLRMNKAKQLLATTDNKIQDVSSQVGYQSKNPFIRMFRKYTGMTPTEYRKEFSNREEE
ncbi:AraC family transcriptional regulator [Paenibacillus sp. J5C_2022]|uniref:helix-turn-helix transcriptional regulator n=1 Tax=Paenibacillus sp. J5C2022 TaxID=2977129 RepID=UPI0021D01EBD|nr:AraC family transcriptional regulator [Paenibacillus sp. J5C2022]MCU6708759.1 AraC family transcriptional regulator [Paenibacillus sp. J5C2022]